MADEKELLYVPLAKKVLESQGFKEPRPSHGTFEKVSSFQICSSQLPMSEEGERTMVGGGAYREHS